MERRPIPGYEGLYEIDKRGNVFSFHGKKTKKLRLKLQKNGYVMVSLNRGRRQKSFYIHRLLMIIFRPREDFSTMYVDHINNVRYDNRLCNLAWVTAAENSNKKTLDGTQLLGVKNVFAKLTDEKVLEIRKLAKKHSYIILSEMFGVTRGTISNIVSHRTWRHLKEETMKKTKKTKKTKKIKK